MTGHAGRRYLLSAASSGLGLATARQLLLAGADVAICGRSDERLAQALDLLQSDDGGRAVGAVLDITDGQALSHWPAQMADHLGGPFDGVFVNTGGPPPGSFDTRTDDDWTNGVSLLLMPVVRLARAAKQTLAEGGSMLFSTSSVVFEPSLTPDLVISACLRSSVSTLVKVLSREWAPQIRVNQIVPGRVETARVQSLDAAKAGRAGVDVEAIISASTATIPLGRYGEALEYGAAAAWLLSAEASYVNGATLAVDGGLMAGV